MTIYAQTITNPGAQSGTTGWTDRSGSGITSRTPGRTTSHSFSALNSFVDDSVWDQEITVDMSLHAAIDADTAAVRAAAWILGGSSDVGHIYVQFLNSSHTILSTSSGPDIDPSTWTQQILTVKVPVNTRYIRIGADLHKNVGTIFNTNFDDFTLELSDDRSTDYIGYFDPKAHQLAGYALGTYPTSQARALQLPIAVVAAAETSNGLHDIKTHQLGAYALVRGKIDRRDLRAWPFTQDDHDFWVLQLGDVGTLIYDKLTGQWAQWKSPSFAYWRGNDGVQWEGWNICCDSESGKLWIIDPEGRLDDETTPITSVITGGINTRMRKFIPNYMAELTVSEGQPPTGIDEGDVGITLRVSDDQGLTYISHGEVAGQGLSEDATIRWYGLGIIPPSGRVFEITDTGYARRIDGFTIEVGGEGANG